MQPLRSHLRPAESEPAFSQAPQVVPLEALIQHTAVHRHDNFTSDLLTAKIFH